MKPSKYKPTKPEEFIGPAREIAGLVQKLAASARADGNEAIKILFNGDPGIGKSELANFLALCLGCVDKHSRIKYNGTKVNVDVVDEIARSCQYRSLYGDYNFIWIDEADKIPPTAQVRFLTLLDDLGDGCAVVCTSNCKLNEFEERFQTRFRVLEVDPPSAADIQALLSRFIDNKQTVVQIAQFACGNVRAALLDADLAVAA